MFVGVAGDTWYAALHAGINSPGSLAGQLNFGAGVSTDSGLKLSSGPHAGFLIGKQTDDWRFDVEAQHGSASVKEMHAASISAAASGSVTYDALTLNAYRYGSIYHSVLGYIGLGVGYGRIQAPAQANLEGCNCFGSAKGSGAWEWSIPSQQVMQCLRNIANYIYQRPALRVQVSTGVKVLVLLAWGIAGISKKTFLPSLTRSTMMRRLSNNKGHQT